MMLLVQILVWIGFGLLAGVLAKAFLPGRDPGGIIFTGVLGVAGALLGNFLLYKLSGRWVHADDALSIPGIAVAVAGAFLLLLAHRLVFGRARRRR